MRDISLFWDVLTFCLAFSIICFLLSVFIYAVTHDKMRVTIKPIPPCGCKCCEKAEAE